MVTRDALCLIIDIFPDEEGKKKLLLHLSGYHLFSVAHGNEMLSQKMYFILLLLGMYLSLVFVFLVTILSVRFFSFHAVFGKAGQNNNLPLPSI